MLLSNSLFLDSEYKADVENKINYLALLNSDAVIESPEDDNDNVTENETTTAVIGNKTLLQTLETKIIISNTDRPYISDGQYLYGTKQISDNYYKILLENHANNEQNTN